MATKIPWSERTWNVSFGCAKVSAGCANCYSEIMAYRLACMGQEKYKAVLHPQTHPKFALRRKWNGKIYCDESALDKPLHWRKPCKIFVNSMSDLFHELVPFSFIEKVMAIIEQCPQHTFQILTKRPEIMAEYFNGLGKQYELSNMTNIIGMTTIENQEMADLRIPYLLKCGFATTGVSVEPMLGPIDFGRIVTLKHPMLYEFTCGCKGRIDFIGDRFPERRGPGGAKDHKDPGWETCCGECGCDKVKMNIDWVIIGPENGPGKRPFKIKWARNLVAQCDGAGVPVFIKPSKWLEWPDDLKNRQEYPGETQ